MVHKLKTEQLAKQVAFEEDLAYGMSSLDGKWYVGTESELRGIGVVEPRQREDVGKKHGYGSLYPSPAQLKRERRAFKEHPLTSNPVAVAGKIIEVRIPLSKILGKDLMDDESAMGIIEANQDFIAEVYSNAKKDALDEGYSEEAAEEKAQEAEVETADNIRGQYDAALEVTAHNLVDQALDFGGSVVTNAAEKHILFKGTKDQFETAAYKLYQIMAGIGMISYPGGYREMAESEGWTPVEAFKNLIGYLHSYPTVYGGQSVDHMFEDTLYEFLKDV